MSVNKLVTLHFTEGLFLKYRLNTDTLHNNYRIFWYDFSNKVLRGNEDEEKN